MEGDAARLEAVLAGGRREEVEAAAEEVLREGAATGRCAFAWPAVRRLLLVLLERVVNAFLAETEPSPARFGETFEQRYARVVAQIDGFETVPFTYQRMCELLLDPRRHYRNTDRFFQAFARLVNGIEPAPPADDEDENGGGGGGGGGDDDDGAGTGDVDMAAA